MAEEKITYNFCQGYGCHEHCVLETHVVDGKIVKTTFPSGFPRGYDWACCAKGVLNKTVHDMPGRLLYPMKRVGERGEGKFERISWDQAFEEIGAKLNELREQYGSRSVLVNTYSCGYPGSFGNAIGPELAERFIGSFDASKLEWTAVDIPDLTACYMDIGSLNYYQLDCRNFLKSKLILVWAGNPIGGTRAAYTTRHMVDAIENGAKLIDIGVLFDSTAAKADQFIAIKPGTDAALALAMCHVLIEEGLVDEEYIIRKTVAPFLVRKDNGLYLRGADLGDEGNEFNVFADKSGEFKYGVPYTYFGEVDAPDLYAEPVVNGIACKTAYKAVVEAVEMYTPEYQEPITGVPADVVRQLTREYATMKPAAIYCYYGMRYKNGIDAARAINLLCILSGNMGLEGGHVMYSGNSDGHPADNNVMEMWCPDGPQNFKGVQSTILENLAALDDPSLQQYKALINPFGNPLLNHPNHDMWKNKIFPNLDLIVAFELRETDMTNYADYVLPEAAALERYDLAMPLNDYVILNSPAVEPPGEALPPADIWRGIGGKVGLNNQFDHTTEDYIRLRLTKDPRVTQAEPPLTFEQLCEQHMFDLNPSHNPYDPHIEQPFYDTATGRIEFYHEELKEIGYELPKFEPALIHDPEESAKYPLVFINGHSRHFMQGQFTNTPEVLAVAEQQFGVYLNPATAAERGLVDGDIVEVFNDRGVVRMPLIVSNAYPEGLAFTYYAFPEKYYPESDAPQALHVPQNTVIHPVKQTWGPMFRAGMEQFLPGPLLFNPGEIVTDTLYDVLVDVRKA